MDFEARYELLEKLGAGSYATVYRARDLELGREVAIKQIHDQYLDDPQQLEKYWQEAQLLASLQHPNIVTMFDISRERGWLILELMQATLAERMAGRQMDLRALRTTVAHCLRALKYLHERGIIHGDIKLSNLMIDARRRIKIGDFGIARRVSDEDGSLLKGTTKYIAPEVVSDEFGDVRPASDLYSLGFSAYELMCGPNFETLFPGLNAFGRNKQVAWMMWHAAADRRLPQISRVLQGVPEDLAHVIQKLCEKDQSKRYKSADEALADLKVDNKAVRPDSSVPAEPEVQQRDAAGRRRLLIAGAAFAVSCLMSLVLAFLPSGESGNPGEIRKQYGVVREVTANRNRFVIEHIETGLPEEFKVGPRPRIFLLNTAKNILLRKLEPGDLVEIERTIDDDGKPVIKITASRPVADRGRIERLDLQSAQLVISIEHGEHREDLPVRVPERARIEINGRPVKLRDLQEGDPVEVWHLQELGAQGGRVADKLAARRLRESAGFVARFDPDKKRLIVTFGKSGTSNQIALPIAVDCKITLKDAELKPEELRTNDRVKIWYDVEFHKIEVTREKLRVSGVVQEIRDDRQDVSILTSTGKRFTFALADLHDITLSLESANLGDLREYDEVEITYDESGKGRLSASTLDAKRPVRYDRWAIVIGAEGFNDQFLTRLQYSLRNANLFKESLTRRYAFSEQGVLMLADESRDVMQRKIAGLLNNARSQTQVLVYVSTHGYVADDGRVYLAGKDFNWDRTAETGLSLDWLARALDGCASKDKILMLDSCHEGSGRDLARQPSTAKMLETLQTPLKTTYAIASCGEGQRGLTWREKQHGLFVYFLADGFDGHADSNRDLRITPDELFAHLKAGMAQAKLPAGKSQTPVLFSPK